MADKTDNSSERLHDLPHEARQLSDRAQEVLRQVCDADLSVATAESCTGGLLASLMTDLPGLSHAFERGFVTYSEDAKVELLGVDPMVIERHGVVSREVAVAMAEGAVANSKAELGVGITGFAGPGSHSPEPGLVHLAVARKGSRTIARQANYGSADRDHVRLRAAAAALEMIAEVARDVELARYSGAG